MTEPEVVTSDNELPSLEIPAPRCSHCLQDVELDGTAAWCERCGISWDRIEDGLQGEYDRDAIEAGTIESDAACADPGRATWTVDVGPSVVVSTWSPCILPLDHTSDHLHPLTRTTTMKPQCGIVGGASTTRGGAPVPDMPCIREENHPGDHANGSRYWPRLRCPHRMGQDRCTNVTEQPHTVHTTPAPIREWVAPY